MQETTYTDHHGRPCKRLFGDHAWPWRRADGRTFAEVDPIGQIGRAKLEAQGSLYERVYDRVHREFG